MNSILSRVTHVAHITRLAAAAAAIVAVVSLCAGCGARRDDGTTAAQSTISVNAIEPRTGLTPGGAGDAGGFRILSTLLAGLITYDEDGKPVNEVAESITPNADSTEYTVTLRDGWTFTDGTPVTAESFTRAWSYAANPANAQINASYFSNIVGYDDLQKKSSDKNAQLSGLKVTGERTFTVTLSSPDSAFAERVGNVPFLPLPASFYDDPDAYAKHPVGNGAYRFSSWTRGQELDVVRNDDYHGAMPAHNAGLTFRFYTSTDAAFADVLAGNLDLLDEVPSSKYAVYRKLDGVTAYTVAGAETQGLNVPERLAHFSGDEGRLRRQAISMALDRDLICRKVFNGTREPAVDFTAPTIIGYSDELANAANLRHDASRARQLWKQADAISPWTGTLKISYSADSDNRLWVEAVANQIADTLGIDAQADPWTSHKELRTAAVDGTIPSPYGSEWPPDYPNVENYLTLRFRSDGGYNEFDYANEKVDELLGKAAAQTDADQANATYWQAEEILLEDLPQIPLWYANVAAIATPKLGNVKFAYNNAPLYALLEKKG
ncbi:peptide ABC transporter substrate-binding protein [Bifidobacterium aerophilum]|uniref:ABC transporter substrate-binding protein n=1 Tax=Bifidobacterium aerophilum TaxID=1798155 RepID=A0A6N9Z5R0_9BIFI|nr:ABC transporter substrate-binding protein [Bifidobacterium aerophilum]NEG90059.1 ABC transporter substrate-binding protein [Bifidobacterium aerophilum]